MSNLIDMGEARWCWTLAVAAMIGARASTAAAADEVAAEHRPLPIYGGNPVMPCGWPTTVYVDGCTGTLVHPEVVIYASHCGTTAQEIVFADAVPGQHRSIPIEFCRTHAEAEGTDWAFCKLAESVEDIAITPPLMGCETEILQPGAQVWMVGFGEIESGAYGTKYEAPAELHSIQNGEAFIGGDGTDTCYGDSGGPAYIQLDDGTWRAFGITSYGPQEECGPGTYFSMMHTGMAWFESESGVDITPCHDADGTWNPGPDCGGFPLQPSAGVGTWPACGAEEIGGPSSTCGAPYGAVAGPPDVAIERPTDGASFEAGANGLAVFDVVVTATDPDGLGIASVQLWVDGVATGDPDAMPPYQFGIALAGGTHDVSASAVDVDGESADSNVVEIEVHDADADADADGGTADDGGAGDDDDDGDGTGDDGAPGLDSFGQPHHDDSSGCGCRQGREPIAGLAWLIVLALGASRVRKNAERSSGHPARCPCPCPCPCPISFRGLGPS